MKLNIILIVSILLLSLSTFSLAHEDFVPQFTGWNEDPETGDGFLVFDIKSGFNLEGVALITLITQGTSAMHSSSTLTQNDFTVFAPLDVIQQKFVACYVGVTPDKQPLACQNFMGQVSTDPSDYQYYSSTLGGFMYSTKAGVVVYEVPASQVPYIKNAALIDQLNLAPGWNVLFTGPWFIGKTLNEVKGSCNFNAVFYWNSGAQSWEDVTNHPTSPLTTPATERNVGMSLLVAIDPASAPNGCTLSSAPALPSLPPVPTPQPSVDLEIESIDVVEDYDANTADISITIRNNGPDDIDGLVDIKLTYGAVTDYTESYQGLVAGEIATRNYLTSFDRDATGVVVLVDPYDTIQESDENNNQNSVGLDGGTGASCQQNSDCRLKYCPTSRICE